MHNKNLLLSFLKNPAFVISLIVLIGLIFASDAADISGLKSQGLGTLSSSKILRIATVLIAGALAFFILLRSNNKGITKLISGNTAFLTTYAILAIMTVVFSHLKAMTLFKGTEMFVVSMICAIAASSPRENTTNYFIKGVMWVYAISCLSALIELSLFGTSHNRQLVGATPLLDSMLQSSYPPLVGNGLGFLGGVTALFGVYLYDSKGFPENNSRILAIIIILSGVTVLFLSYTRSALVFFIFCFLLYAYLEKKFVRITLVFLLMIAALATPIVQNKITAHMKKGSTDEQIETMSGRTQFWKNIISRDPVQLLVGEGFATGTLFQDYSNTNRQVFKYRNAHNSVAEIIMSSGIIGATIWTWLIFRIFMQLNYARLRLKKLQDNSRLKFHNFVYVLFVFSMMRSLMNSTFVYLDLFMFILISVAAYAETTKTYVINASKETLPLKKKNDQDKITSRSSEILARKKTP